MRGVLLVVMLAACGGSAADGPPGDGQPGSCTGVPAPSTGEGTYYAATGAGSCSFDPVSAPLVAAINAPDYANAAWCGACLAVTGPLGEVTVRVVDKCPGCKHGDLDLSEEAFVKIAQKSAGRVPITWHEVACDVPAAMSYHLKDGSSQYWTAIQVRDHRYRIATLEARDAAGAYHAIARTDYNYFVATSGLGVGPYALRITDTRGHVVEDEPVALGADVTRTGTAQLPSCP